MSKPFRQVDVFGHTPFSGNPVAVVADADDLTDDQMKAVSRWTNLSECTFLLAPASPEADYRLRIFSLDHELPFAGHPTLGSARAWLDLGGSPQNSGEIIQECGMGLVRLRHSGDRLAFQAPPLRRSGPVDPTYREQLRRTLRLSEDQMLDAEWTDNGPGWVTVLVDSTETLYGITPDPEVIEGPELKHIGAAALTPQGAETALEVRGFFCDDTGAFREDPVTGSLNASTAQWLTSSERISAPYTAGQGSALQRDGRIHIDADDQGLWVGGSTAVAVSGTINL